MRVRNTYFVEGAAGISARLPCIVVVSSSLMVLLAALGQLSGQLAPTTPTPYLRLSGHHIGLPPCRHFARRQSSSLKWATLYMLYIYQCEMEL